MRNIGSPIYNVEDSITLISAEAEVFEFSVLFLDPFSEDLPVFSELATSPW